MAPSLFAPPSAAPETLEGAVERLVFRNPEGSWAVVRLRAGRGALVTAVGPLVGVQAGEQVRLTGRWESDPKFGDQFRVDSFVTVTPATVEGLRRYLGSGLVPGIGPVMAKRLVARFGLETLDVIDRDPDRLTEVPGIGLVRSRKIQQAWQEQKQIRQVMIFLQGHGVSTHLAVRIFRRFGPQSLEVVRQAPYRLATEVTGIGFKTADRIASQLGVPPDDPGRAAAGVLHALAQESEQGHTYTPRSALVARAAELLAIPEAAVELAIGRLAADEAVILDPGPEPGETAVYARPLFLAERSLASRLRRLLARPAAPLALDLEAAVRWFESRSGVTLAPEQKEALHRVADETVTVITGGPGTGKTTLVRALVEIFRRKGQRIALAAPTGRAAKRLAEASGGEAVTLHRLLEFAPATGRFQRDDERPLGVDLLVVDEVSMVDLVLGHHLLKAVPETARLVLVGDADQLPSVGPGRVLGDLVETEQVPSVRLHRVFRQARESLVVTNAHRVREGRLPRLPDGDEGDFFFVERGEPSEAASTVVELVAERIPRRFGLDPFASIQVLSPMRRGELGTGELNRRLQERLNPGGAPLAGGFRIGDKVMQTRNNYELDLFNGDIGVLTGVDEDEGEALLAVDERTVRIDLRDLDDLELAYACSIHKAQGSEYPAVVLVLHRQHHVMLERNLLYTGLTRAKRLLVLVGSADAVRRAVASSRPAARRSRLRERVAGR